MVRIKYILFYLIILSFSVKLLSDESNKDNYLTENTIKNLIVKVETSYSNNIDPNNLSIRYGGGIIFGKDEKNLYIVTAKHIVFSPTESNMKNIKKQVTIEFKNNTLVKANKIEPIDAIDLAIISFDFNNKDININEIPTECLGYSSILERRSKVYPCGFILTEDWFIPPDPLSIHSNKYGEISFSSIINPRGLSGGGLFNAQWQLIGIIVTDNTTTIKAISFDTVLSLLMQRGYIDKIFLTYVKEKRNFESYFNFISEYTTSREVNALVVDNNIAYLANGDNGLTLVDISNMKNPIFKSNLKLKNAYDITYLDNTVYLLHYDKYRAINNVNDCISIIDVTDKNKPRLISGYTYQNNNITSDYLNLIVKNNIACISGYGSIELIDISNKNLPKFLWYISIDNLGHSCRTYIYKTFLFITGGEKLYIYDIKNPKNPIVKSIFDIPSYSYGIIILEHIAYILLGGSAFITVDITNIESPKLMGRYNFSGDIWAHNLFVHNNIAYMTINTYEYIRPNYSKLLESKIVAIDIIDPLKLEKIGEYKGFDLPTDIYVNDAIVFITDQNRGIKILKVNNP